VRSGDLSLADVGIEGEDSSHGIKRSGGSETIYLWSDGVNKFAFFLCNNWGCLAKNITLQGSGLLVLKLVKSNDVI